MAKINWRNRCKCPCGCNRRCAKPYITCSYCAQELHNNEEAKLALVLVAGREEDRARTHCSSCGKADEWYRFKPGDGRCDECAP